MTTTTLRSAPARAIAAALALTAAVSSTSTIGGAANGRMSQYCAPVEETADVSAHRIYCRNRRGWEPDGTTPAAANRT